MKRVSRSKVLHNLVVEYLRERPPFYAFIRPQEGYYFKKYRKYLKEKVLDFGCGDGFFANLVWGGDGEIEVGLDVEMSRIDEAKQLNIYNNLEIYGGRNISFGDEFFNTAVSNCVLEHLPNLRENLEEIFRTLKPGGRFLTTVMTDKWEEYMTGSKFLGSNYLEWMRKVQVHENVLSHNQWREEFERVGFKVVKEEGYLGERVVKFNEWSHFLALPSLVSYELTGKWVLWRDWYKVLNIDQKILDLVEKDLETKPKDGAGVFFVMEK